jgi:hypothetical protein
VTDKANRPAHTSVRQKMGDAILDLVLAVPGSDEHPPTHNPEMKARALGRSASRKASLLAGSFALPPGVLGWLTVLPELLGVWRLQAQMVSDIAAVFGKQATLNREQMLYCLFKHVSAQLFRDVMARVGERYFIQAASTPMIRSIAQALGVKVTKNLATKGASRLVPLIGAVGVGAYAYYDTTQVAKTAIELFSRELVLKAEDSE